VRSFSKSFALSLAPIPKPPHLTARQHGFLPRSACPGEDPTLDHYEAFSAGIFMAVALSMFQVRL